jgi:hypothetical protein
VGGTRPLAIDDFVIVSRIFRIRTIQKSASSALSRRGLDEPFFIVATMEQCLLATCLTPSDPRSA